METMRALVAQAIGEPQDVLRLETRSVPEPGRGEVRVRVQAAPIHPTDLHILRGRYGFAAEFPAVLGVEAVGIVDRLGAGVDSLAVGQRVITVGLTGTWQEFVVTSAERVLAVPEGLSLSTAAQLLTNPLTAVLLTTRELALQPGEWLLQTAAGSTVGKLVVQLGNHLGFKTINVVRRRAAVQELLELGATEVITTEDEDLLGRIAETTAGDAVRKAIDSVGGRVGAAIAASLAPGGELIVYGALSTHRQTDPDLLTVTVPANALIYGTKTVRGFWLYRWFATTSPDQIEAALSRTLELVAGGALRIPDGQPVPLERFTEAVRLAEEPGHGGKPLLMLQAR